MSRVVLVCSEPLRERMAGIGIRYVEMANALSAEGLEVLLLAPGDLEGIGDIEPRDLGLLSGVALGQFSAEKAGLCLTGAEVVVAQGQLANDVVSAAAGRIPVAIDLYDPWMIENMHYSRSLGLDPYRNDHASWVHQMASADFFLCSSEEQKLFYLGFLAALGRVNPRALEDDPDLERLIAVVPFGQPVELPEAQPVLPAREAGERRLLFGGLYDWYDPWPLLEALETLNRESWRLLLVRNPNSGTPQRVMGEVEAWCQSRGWGSRRVQILDWVPFERRYDLLRDVDLLVATHGPGLETSLAMRTRFLDALRAGCPILTTEGGTVSRLLSEHRAGWVVPASSADALGRALVEILDHSSSAEILETVQRATALGKQMAWPKAVEPLVRFCRSPRIDPTKAEFAFRPSTRTPPDPLTFRIRRRLRRLRRHLSRLVSWK